MVGVERPRTERFEDQDEREKWDNPRGDGSRREVVVTKARTRIERSCQDVGWNGRGREAWKIRR